MHITIALTTFAVILLAELPDKSLFASLILGTRFHPFGVWLGIAAAFTVHVAIAVAIGQALSLLPTRWVAGGILAVLAVLSVVEAVRG